MAESPSHEIIDIAHFLNSLDQVSRSLLKAKDVDGTIEDVLTVVFTVFQCDRIWLFYPCDPDAGSFRVLAEKNRPEYPGAFSTGQELPITPEAARTIRKCLSLGTPVVFDPESGNKLDDIAKQFSVQSQMMMAVYPKSGKPWMFGMHQCAYARVWTRSEQILFKEIGYRVVENLNNLILLRDLKQSEQKYRNLLENLPQRIFHKDRNSVYISCNSNFAQDLNSNPDAISGTSDYDHFPKKLAEKYIHDDHTIMATGETRDFIEKYMTNGRELWIHTVKAPIRDENGRVSGVLGLFWDITDLKHAEEEKKQLEIQLRQAYKMEAIGTLAGGIAHDFNNILAAMLGYTEIAIADIPNQSPARRSLEQVLNAGYRAKDLVRHILAYSRQEKQERTPTQLDLVVNEALILLRASIPTTIDIKHTIDPHCGNILANPTQIHQVVMNICTNAAQAMAEHGGTLEIRLDQVHLTAADLERDPPLKPGLYVRLTISDTGGGIAPDHIDRIFDPYFTTKKVGEGSGMGLAVVHGIVKNHHGMITVDSERGQGTTFNIFFPKIEAEFHQQAEFSETLPNGDERILVVDDETMVAEVTKLILERRGYCVTSETRSKTALERVRAQPDAFDLIITDQTMPEMTGEQLAKELVAVKPDIRIIVSTGYSSNMDTEKARSLGIHAFIMKPVNPVELTGTVRRVLDA